MKSSPEVLARQQENRKKTKSRPGAPDARLKKSLCPKEHNGSHDFGVLIGRTYGPAYTHRRGMVHFAS